MSKETRIPVYHAGTCGAIVMYFKKQPAAGAVIESENCLWPDGTQPQLHEAVRCKTCGDLLAAPIFKADEGNNYASTSWPNKDVEMLLELYKVMTEADGDTPAE